MYKKRIRTCVIASSLDQGGAERIMGQLSKAFHEYGHEVHFLLMSSREVVYEYRGDLHCLCFEKYRTKSHFNIIKRIYFFLNRIILFRKKIKDINPDVSISVGVKPNFYNVLSTNRAVIRYGNAVTYKNKISLFQRLFIYFSCYKAWRVIASSKGIKNELLSKISKKLKIDVLYNSVDINTLNDMALITDNLNPTFKRWLEENNPIIINVGRLVEQKGQWHLIRAFSIIKKRMDCKLLIVGSGNQETFLKQLVCHLDLEYDVLMLDFQENPFAYIKRSSLFVFPSLWEGLGIVILESLSLQTPVISSDCHHGPREILSPNTDINFKTNTIEYAEYGILVPVPDGYQYNYSDELTNEENILANAIIKLLENKKYKKHYIEKSKERAKDFDIENWKKKWVSYIDELILNN